MVLFQVKFLELLTILFNIGLINSSIITAKGTLSALGIKLHGTNVGSHSLVIRYMKGVYNIRPTIPKYSVRGMYHLF